MLIIFDFFLGVDLCHWFYFLLLYSLSPRFVSSDAPVNVLRLQMGFPVSQPLFYYSAHSIRVNLSLPKFHVALEISFEIGSRFMATASTQKTQSL